jgi:hypothetical protein
VGELRPVRGAAARQLSDPEPVRQVTVAGVRGVELAGSRTDRPEETGIALDFREEASLVLGLTWDGEARSIGRLDGIRASYRCGCWWLWETEPPAPGCPTHSFAVLALHEIRGLPEAAA